MRGGGIRGGRGGGIRGAGGMREGGRGGGEGIRGGIRGGGGGGGGGGGETLFSLFVMFAARNCSHPDLQWRADE